MMGLQTTSEISVQKYMEEPTNNKKLHKCDQCNYSSFYVGNLYRHMRQRKHNPEKILKTCDQCKFALVDQVDLEEHMRIPH